MKLYKHQTNGVEKIGHYAQIKGYEGYYVTKYGSVYSVKKRARNSPQGLLKLAVSTDRDGYKIVGLRKLNSKISTQRVHRLVAIAFLPNPKEHPLVRHIDGNPQNNNIINLAWGTAQDNSNDSKRHGRTLLGTKNHAAKITPTEVKSIRALCSIGRMTYKQIAEKYGITKGHIANIVARRVWKHV